MWGHEREKAGNAWLLAGEAELDSRHKISDAESTWMEIAWKWIDGNFHNSHSCSESARGEHGISLSFGGPVLGDGRVQCPTGTHDLPDTYIYTYGGMDGAWLLIVLVLVLIVLLSCRIHVYALQEEASITAIG